MDNKCSMTVKNFIQQDMKARIKFVEANNHRVNAAERAIQTFKNHFVSGLCTLDNTFILQLCCAILQQAELTLKLLQTSQINT